MRKPFLLATLAASVALIVLVGMYASAQMPARPPARPAYGGSPVALIDVSRVFKEHVRFKAHMNQMKADVERAESEVKSMRTSMMQLARKLEDWRSGSPEYKGLEEEITQRQADLAVRVQLQKKDFLQREAKIYYQTYQEVLYEVDNFAKHNGISMVLRFNGDSVNMAVPQSVLQHINKPVVWYARDRDITNLVLDRLNGPVRNPQISDDRGRPRPNVVIPPR